MCSSYTKKALKDAELKKNDERKLSLQRRKLLADPLLEPHQQRYDSIHICLPLLAYSSVNWKKVPAIAQTLTSVLES